MIAIHKAVADTGGAIGDEISSGTVAALLPEIKLTDQNDGASFTRKFYLKNNNTRTETGTLTLTASTPFTAIIFESLGDIEVVTDLTGTETNESPISFSIAAGAHQGYWVKVTVPALSTETVNYETISLKLTY